MNKQDLIDYVSELTTLPKKDSKTAIDAVIEGILEGLRRDKKVSIVGFGTFLIVDKKERTARNPKTGAEVIVPAKTVPKFKSSKQLKEMFS